MTSPSITINTYLSVNLNSEQPYFRISLTDGTIGTKAGKDCKDEALTQEHQKEISDFFVDYLESTSLKPPPVNRRQEKALLLFKQALGTISAMPGGITAQEAHRKTLIAAIKEYAALYFAPPETKRKPKHTRSYARDRTNPSFAVQGDQPVNVHTASLTPLPKGFSIDLLIKDKVVCDAPTLGAYLHYWRGNQDKAENLEKTIKQYALDGRVVLLQQLRDEPHLSLVLQELLERGFRHFPEDIPRWSRELMSQMIYTSNSKKQLPAVSKSRTIEEDFGIKITAFERLLADILEPLFEHQSLQSMITNVWKACKPQSTESIDENSAAISCERFLTKIVNNELFDMETLAAKSLTESLLLNSMVTTLGHVLRAFVQDPYVTPGQEIYCRYKTPQGKEGRSIEYTIHPNGNIEVRYRNKIDFLDFNTKLPFSIILQNSLVTSLRLPKWTSTIAVEVASDAPELGEPILSQLEKQGFTTNR